MLTRENDMEVHALHKRGGRSRRSPVTPAMTARQFGLISTVTARQANAGNPRVIRSSRSWSM